VQHDHQLLRWERLGHHHHPSFIIHHSSFIIHRPSSIIHHPSSWLFTLSGQRFKVMLLSYAHALHLFPKGLGSRASNQGSPISGREVFI